MEITEIKVFPVDEEKLKAFVSIVLDQCFMVNDIKVIQGRDGFFISMPSRRKRNGRFKDVAHPLNNETRRMIEDQILAEYQRETGGEQAEPRAAASPLGVEQERAKVEPQVPESVEGKTLEEVAEMHLRDSFWNP
jgi:stage V sporulation protein G